MADPFLDALGISVPDAGPSAKAPAKAYDPTDLAVRLAMLEDSDPAGRAAVAGVMANRAKAAKGGLLGVLTAPNAFEPWKSKQKELAAIDPNSDDYKATAAAITPILQGQADNPVGTATNFYSPESQAALSGDGRKAKPEFDDGKGVRIGGNLFFGTGASGQPSTQAAAGGDFLSTLGVDPDKPVAGVTGADGADLAANSGPMTIKVVNGQVVDGATGKPVPKAQVDALHALVSTGKLDANGKINGVQVHMQRDAGDAFPAGDYYVAAGTGELKGGPRESSALGGVGQGVLDNVNTLVHAFPGSQDSDIGNALEAGRQLYGAAQGGDTKSQIGRLIGQGLGAAPLLAGGEAAIAPVVARTGLPSMAEALAAKGLGPGLAKLLGGAVTMSGRGAAEGAAAAAQTSSANPEQSVGSQIEGGALGGALLAPVLGGGVALGKGIGNGARALLEPHTANGPANIAERRIQEVLSLGPSQPADLTVHVPGSSPNLAEATASAPLAQMFRNLRQNPLVSGMFEAADDANNKARQLVTMDAQGDPGTVADLGRARAALVDAHKAHVLGGAGEADVAPVVAHLDEALNSPEALHPEVAPALQKARDALVTEPDKDLTPAESAAFHQAALATTGGKGDALTPEAMDSARSALGKKFDEIASKTDMAWDDKLRGDIADTLHNVAQVVPESTLPPLFKQLDNIASTANDGKTISGESYQALTKQGAPLSALQKAADPTIRDAANQIRDALDDALERSVAAKPQVEGQPNLTDELRSTRLAYKNLKTLEAARRTAGPDGVITPKALYGAVKQNFGNYTYKGGGPLGDIAESALAAQDAKAPVLEKDPAKLFALRDNLAGKIDKLAKAGETDDAARAAAARLSGVRDQMDAALDKAAPGYAEFRHIADSTAEPIEAQRYLQSLPLTTNGARGGTVTLNLVNSALNRIEKARSLPGPHPAKSVSDATLVQLRALQADLERQANRDLGKARGSETNQLGSAQAEFGAMGAPLLAAQHVAGMVPVIGRHVAQAVGEASNAANQRVMGALAARLLNPEPLNIPEPGPGSRVAQVGRRVLATLPGSAGGVLGSRLLGGK